MGQVQDSLEKTAMRLLLLASLASLGLSAPQNSFFVLTRGSGARESTSYIDYSTGLRSSSSKVASAKVIRPTTDSALAYMKEYFGEDLCSAAAQAYLESILDGDDAAEANAAAASAYKAASRAGATITPGSPCEAAKTSFVRNYNSGRDVVQEATLAFVNAWPGAKEGNPCAASGKAYMEAIINGKSQKSAALGASKAFIAAFDALAKDGKSLKVNDPACAAASKAFISSNSKDSATAAAAEAFIDATLTDAATEYDGVCAAAALAYMNSFADGNDEATSTLYAAKAFYSEYAKGKSASSESTCVKAALGYAGKSSDQDPSRTAAMLTFINKSIESGEEIADPVCAAATLAYLDAKIAKKSDKEAAGDASLAYLAAIAENPEPSAACKDSATAYIETLSS